MVRTLVATIILTAASIAVAQPKCRQVILHSERHAVFSNALEVKTVVVTLPAADGRALKDFGDRFNRALRAEGVSPDELDMHPIKILTVDDHIYISTWMSRSLYEKVVGPMEAPEVSFTAPETLFSARQQKAKIHPLVEFIAQLLGPTQLMQLRIRFTASTNAEAAESLLREAHVTTFKASNGYYLAAVQPESLPLLQRQKKIELVTVY